MKELVRQAKKNELECLTSSKAYQIWLRWLAPANWFFITGAALFSLVAGASLLVTQGFITSKSAGLLALISGALTIIHTKLNCDNHQAECKRLKNNFKVLALQYNNLKTVSDTDEYRKRLQSLNEKRAALEESIDAEPSTKSIEKARKLVIG